MLLVPQPSSSPNDPLVRVSPTGVAVVGYYINCVRIGRCGNEILLCLFFASQLLSVSCSRANAIKSNSLADFQQLLYLGLLLHL